MTTSQVREASPAVDSFVTNGSVKLAVRDYGGTGPSVLLIPGAGRTLADFTPIASYLVKDHHVVAMDLRGHGFSDDGPWTWDDALEDTRAVVAALSLEPVTIVGHSLGGMIAALYGERFPGIRAAVNLDGHGQGRPDQYVGIDPEEVAARMAEMLELGKQMQSAQPATLTAEQVDAARSATLEKMEAVGIGSMGAEGFDRAIARNADGTFSPRPNAATTTALLSEVKALDLFSLYRRVACPLLVYNAFAAGLTQPGLPDWVAQLTSAFRVGLARDLEALAAEVPNVQVQPIDATHALIAEQPELIARQVSTFITGTTAAR